MQTPLHHARQRNCFWAPDFNALSFLKPQPGKALSLSVALGSAGSVGGLSVAASSFSTQTVSLGGTGATVPTPANNQAVLIENWLVYYVPSDNSGKLQMVVPPRMQVDGNGFLDIEVDGPVCPLTFPALNGAELCWRARLPIPLLIPRPYTANAASLGGVFTVSPMLFNTDGAGAHNYTVQQAIAYRFVENVDFSVGATFPGAGISSEWV
jgi:hypothetical protein